MKRRMSMILVAFSTTIVFTIDRNVNAEVSSAFAEAAKTTPVLVLDGSPHDRGLRHGQVLKDQIHRIVRLWKERLSDQHKIPADTFINRFMRATNYIPAIKKHTPGLLEEIRGIADGAEIDFDTIFVFQFFDEVGAQGTSVAANRCSSLGLSHADGEPTIVAQNNDLEIFRDGFQVVLHIKDEKNDLEALVHSNAGCIGWNGLNNKSVGICVNTIAQLSNCTDGLPVNCVIRGVLMQPTEKDAVGFVRRIKHASGANYVIGGPKRVRSFECSANRGAVRFRPDGQNSVVWHTNHPLVSDDYNEGHKEWLKTAPVDRKPGNSEVRLQSLKRRLTNRERSSRVALIKETLTSKDSGRHPICGSKGPQEAYTEGGFFTFASTIMVLSENPVLHISCGPPDVAGYEKITFSP